MKENNTKQHFNNIAENYYEEINGHIREHLINKWWSFVSGYFPNNSKVIDIGCGDGANVAFLRSKGINATGVDLSGNLIKRGKERYPELQDLVFEGDALNLHFPDNTFDVAVMIGVLHHIHLCDDQKRAVLEALRIVKNNGFIIIRECNLINPFFRIFWNYIFPLTAKIDKFGGESWISVRDILDSFKGAVDNIFYFTFIPNFFPQFCFPIAAKIEKFLEKSPLKKLSAHYVVILRKRNKL